MGKVNLEWAIAEKRVAQRAWEEAMLVIADTTFNNDTKKAIFDMIYLNVMRGARLMMEEMCSGAREPQYMLHTAKVGEAVIYQDKAYEVCEAINTGCRECCFADRHDDCKKINARMPCSYRFRDDKKNIIYKRITTKKKP